MTRDAAVGGQAYQNLAVAILLGIGSLLMLLTSISVPILHSLRMFRLTTNVDGIDRNVNVGLWGYCVVPVKSSTLLDAAGSCSKPVVGFVLDNVVANALQIQPLNNVLTKSHTSSLVIFPIATVMTFLSCILQAKIHISRQAGVGAVTLVFIFSSISTLLCLISFIVQISVVAVADTRLDSVSDSSKGSLQFQWGGTIWLTAIAIVADLVNLLFLYNMRSNLATIEAQAEQQPNAQPNSYAQEIQEQEDKAIQPPRPRPGEAPPGYS